MFLRFDLLWVTVLFCFCFFFVLVFVINFRFEVNFNVIDKVDMLNYLMGSNKWALCSDSKMFLRLQILLKMSVETTWFVAQTVTVK